MQNKIILLLLIFLTALTACHSLDSQSKLQFPAQNEIISPTSLISVSTPDLNAAEPAIAA
ncbi:MAG: hypothetical protein M3388_15325 [Acidobacteriota bacterium]|nr:hypothetical protein [Acidobacteriota bacterium]